MGFSARLPEKYYVYIVKVAGGTYYSGTTNNPPRRSLRHNGELIELMFCEEYLTISFACQRESEIKKMHHSEIENLINCRN